MWQRNFKRSIVVIVLLLALITSHASVLAQKPAAKSTNKADNSRFLEETALYSLDSVINELRQVEDLSTRVTLSEEVVRLLTVKQPVKCRQLLDATFTDALQLKAPVSGDGSRESLDSIIRRIIKLAASFDRKLAQSYVDKYAEYEAAKSTDGRDNTQLPSSTSDLLLKLATELIDGDANLAVSVAEKAISVAVPPRALVFLGTLRKKDPQLANRFFAAALQSVRARQGYDVNEMFLLYAYVFSPLRVPLVVPEGLALQQIPEYQRVAENYPADPALAKQYLQVLVSVMLDSNRLVANLNHLTAGAGGDLYFVKIIAPQASLYFPEAVTSLSSQEVLLMNFLDPEGRTSLQSASDKWNNPPNELPSMAKGDSSTVESMLRRADDLSDAADKDQLYYMAATIAVREKHYDVALNAVGRISQKDRDRAKQFILFSIAEQDVKDNQFEKAMEFARKDDDLVRRAYIFNLIADAFLTGNNKDTARASEILTEVEQITKKLESSQEKISTLVGSAVIYSRFDNIRALELLREAISTANKVEGFTGETAINRNIQIGGFGFFYYMYDEKFTFTEAIKQQGRKDFNSILVDVQNLKSRVPRLKAILALCSAVISPKTA